MDSAAFRVDGKKDDLGFSTGEVASLKRTQKLLWCAIAVLGVLAVFSFAGVIWLAVDVADDEDDGSSGLTTSSAPETNSLVTLSRRAHSSEDAQPLFSGTGFWTEKEPLPYGRSDHHAVAVDDYVYIIGGLNGTNEVVQDVTIYDTVLDTYSTGPALPVPLHRFASAYDPTQRRVYVLGGISETDGQASDTVYVLDIDAQRWRKSRRLPSPRSDLCGAYLDGRVYAIGGYSLNYERTLDTVDAFDVESGEWQTVQSMPTGRGDCAAAALSGRLIVVGGYNDETGQWNADAFRDEVEVFVPVRIIPRGDVPGTGTLGRRRGDKAVAVIDGSRLLVVGGETHNRGEHTMVATHHVEEYDIVEDVWTDRAPIPSATFRTSAAAVGSMVFVFGGHQTCDQPSQGNGETICTESDSLQVYFDVDHPRVFIV